MGLFSGALSLAGTALSAYSQYKQGQDAKDAYEYNEALARYQAQHIRESGAIELAKLERNVGDFISRSHAIAGKSGTVPDIGSNRGVIGRLLREKEIDAGIIRWRTASESRLAEQGADLLSTQAGQFATAGNINAATTLLGGVSNWDWKTSTLSTPAYSSRPPVPAFSGYTRSR